MNWFATESYHNRAGRLKRLFAKRGLTPSSQQDYN